MLKRPIWYALRLFDLCLNLRFIAARQMREIAEIELAIQGGTEKIETLGMGSL
jgi:hypothetical protein